MSCWAKCATAVVKGVSEIQEIKELILKHQATIDEVLALLRTLSLPAAEKAVNELKEPLLETQKPKEPTESKMD